MKQFIHALLILSVFSVIFIVSLNINASNQNEKSPHTEALILVFSTQQGVIRKTDEENWWQDTNERTWSVKRPFSPGVIDSTHTFVVIYKIAGKKVALWNVDTKKKTVKLEEVNKGKRP